jgi:hypothetical protein
MDLTGGGGAVLWVLSEKLPAKHLEHVSRYWALASEMLAIAITAHFRYNAPERLRDSAKMKTGKKHVRE